jgi:hypothetical protein
VGVSERGACGALERSGTEALGLPFRWQVGCVSSPKNSGQPRTSYFLRHLEKNERSLAQPFNKRVASLAIDWS